MAQTAILRPNADVDSVWSINGGGSTRWEALTEAGDLVTQPTAPSTTKSIQSNTNAQTQNLELGTQSGVATATAATIWVYASCVGGNDTVTVSLRDGSGNLVGSAGDITVTSAAWASVSVGSISLNQAAVDALRLRLVYNKITGTATPVIVSAAYVVLTYSSTGTRTVPATVAVSTVNTRTVPATARVSTVNSRTIPATVDVSVYVPPGNQRLSGYAADEFIPIVDGGAGNQRLGFSARGESVGAVSDIVAAAPSIEERTVPATVAVSTVSTRTVPATVAVSTITSKTIPATVDVSTINTRTVPGTVAVSTVGSRTVPATVAIATITTRTIPATAAVSTVESRTIPATVDVSVVTVGPTRLTPVDSSSIPAAVVFTWRMTLVQDDKNAHCRLIVAESPADTEIDGSFTTAVEDRHSARGGFEYDTSAGDDGTGPWVAFPADGLPVEQQERIARVAITLDLGTYDWRVRMERGDA